MIIKPTDKFYCLGYFDTYGENTISTHYLSMVVEPMNDIYRHAETGHCVDFILVDNPKTATKEFLHSLGFWPKGKQDE